MSKKRSDLVKVGKQEMSKEFFEQFADDGTLEHVSDDLKRSMPLLQLCQGSSGVVKQGTARPGEFYDSATEAVLKPPITITPIFIFSNRLRWGENMEDSMPLCRSRDGITGEGDPGGKCAECPERKIWSDDKMQGTCDEQITMIVWVWEQNAVTFLNMARTKIKPAKRIMKLIQSTKLKCFCSKFKLDTKLDRSAQGVEFHNIYLDSFENNDVVQVMGEEDKEQLGIFAKYHNDYRKQFESGELLSPVEDQNSENGEPEPQQKAEGLPVDANGDPVF